MHGAVCWLSAAPGVMMANAERVSDACMCWRFGKCILMYSCILWDGCGRKQLWLSLGCHAYQAMTCRVRTSNETSRGAREI